MNRKYERRDDDNVASGLIGLTMKCSSHRRHLNLCWNILARYGLHTPEQQNLDFEAVLPFATDNCFFALHDVVNFNLLDGFRELSERHPGYCARILWRTPSGMGVLYPECLSSAVGQDVDAFSEPDDLFRGLRRMLQRKRTRRDLRRQRRGLGRDSGGARGPLPTPGDRELDLVGPCVGCRRKRDCGRRTKRSGGRWSMRVLFSNPPWWAGRVR